MPRREDFLGKLGGILFGQRGDHKKRPQVVFTSYPAPDNSDGRRGLPANEPRDADTIPIILEEGHDRRASLGREKEEAGFTKNGFFSVSTEVGRVREHNEDGYGHWKDTFVVADGMGGLAKGEYASDIAVNCILDARKSGRFLNDESLFKMDIRDALDGLVEGHDSGNSDTTLAAFRIEGSYLKEVVHVGDCRIYVFNEHGDLVYLTKDQSMVQRFMDEKNNLADKLTAERTTKHNYVSGCTGKNASPDYGIYCVKGLRMSSGGRFLREVEMEDHVWLKPGYVVMSCSDGLHGMIDHDVLVAEVKQRRSDPDNLRRRLSELALKEGGGGDNITVCVYKHISI